MDGGKDPSIFIKSTFNKLFQSSLKITGKYIFIGTVLALFGHSRGKLKLNLLFKVTKSKLIDVTSNKQIYRIFNRQNKYVFSFFLSFLPIVDHKWWCTGTKK